MNPNPHVRSTEPGHPTPSHILKPHHLQLVRILDLTFRKYADKKLPPAFLLHMYRVLMVEVAEVREPATYDQIIRAVEDNPSNDIATVQELANEFRLTHTFIITPDLLGLFFKDAMALVAGREEDDDTGSFERRSLFGFFVRRCFVSFVKLSFEAQSQLFKDYHAWVGNKFKPDSIKIRLDILDNSYYLFKVHADKKQFAEVDPYAWYVKDDESGDMMNAEEKLRRFFEQYFHEGSDSGMRQLALLHLARMHYVQQEYPACQKLLHEAINVARSHNDRLTLQHCLGLLHRIPDKGKKAMLNEIQPDLHPFEILYDVKKLMLTTNQQPLSATFDKIVQVTALYDNWSDFQHHRAVSSEQWAQHTVQAIAFDLLGSPALSGIHNRIVMSFTSPGSDDNTRLTSIMNYAYGYATAGHYQESVAMLLDPSTWTGLSLGNYNIWAGQIWHILVLRASRRGQSRLYTEFLKKRRPNVKYNSREYWFENDESPSMDSIIRDPLHEYLAMRAKRQAHHYVEPLLKALWHAEFQQRWGLYRTALLCLADLGLEFGMTKWSCRLVQRMLPQVMTSPPELKAFALVTYSRCLLSLKGTAIITEPHLKQCFLYLSVAEENLKGIESLQCLQDTQFLMATVYHNFGMEAERDKAAKACFETEQERKKAAGMASEDWVVEVWDLVSKIGAKIAAKT